MGEQEKKQGANDSFEENLRYILTPGPATSSSSAPANGVPAPPSRSPAESKLSTDSARRLQEIAQKRNEAEQKALFWFKLLRPIAFIMFGGLLAVFVFRIVTFGN
jgi:hypothetical protein